MLFRSKLLVSSGDLCDFLGLVLDNCSIANPLLFKTSFFIREELFPVSMVSFGSLNLHSSCIFILLEELDFDDGLSIKTFDFVTLLSAVDAIGLNSDSNMLFLGGLSIVVIHYIVGFVLALGDGPLFSKFIGFNILLNVVEDSAWLDRVQVDVN